MLASSKPIHQRALRALTPASADAVRGANFATAKFRDAYGIRWKLLLDEAAIAEKKIELRRRKSVTSFPLILITGYFVSSFNKP